MSELAADGIPVAVSLRVLKLSRQPYYRWRKQQVTESELVEAYRANALFDAHRDDPKFGYRFLAGEAEAAGESMCERAAWRICRNNQWWSVFGKKRGKNGKRPGPPVHDDLVKRDFTADDVNELWLTDITEHPTDEGKLYLCAIKDVFSGRIVGDSISDRMKARLAVNALNNAASRRGDVAGCIMHSDRGSQFRARSYVHALNRHHLIRSMGKVGAAGDNAAMESFFALLQKNVLDRKRWRTREELRIAIITWIERTYHRRRRQARLGRLTPIEYETIMNPTVSLAATLLDLEYYPCSPDLKRIRRDAKRAAWKNVGLFERYSNRSPAERRLFVMFHDEELKRHLEFFDKHAPSMSRRDRETLILKAVIGGPYAERYGRLGKRGRRSPLGPKRLLEYYDLRKESWQRLAPEKTEPSIEMMIDAIQLIEDRGEWARILGLSRIRRGLVIPASRRPRQVKA